MRGNEECTAPDIRGILKQYLPYQELCLSQKYICQFQLPSAEQEGNSQVVFGMIQI